MHDAPDPRVRQPLAQAVVHVPQKHWSPAPQSSSCSQGDSQLVCESVPFVELQASKAHTSERRTVIEWSVVRERLGFFMGPSRGIGASFEVDAVGCCAH
jgi:hypothetical protein